MVELRSKLVDDNFIVEITDNGPGIAAQDADTIFDMFTRGEQGRTDATPGAGLGLAISRKIVARMSGALELVPCTTRGACFRVTLPAC